MMPSKNLLTRVNRRRYPETVAETTATGFGDLRMLADNRRSAVFLRPYAFARLYDQRVGLGGETFGSAGANVPVRQPRSVPAHPFGDGKRAFNLNVGSRIMLRRIQARPEQAPSPKSLTATHPLFTASGTFAAELWLTGHVPLTAGEWRDLRYRNLIAGTEWLPGDEDRRAAFDAAFCQTIALSIAHQSRVEVRHG